MTDTTTEHARYTAPPSIRAHFCEQASPCVSGAPASRRGGAYSTPAKPSANETVAAALATSPYQMKRDQTEP